MYTQKGLLSNSYDKKSFWYEWISKGDYDFSRLKMYEAEHRISVDEVKTCFVIADTFDGNLFINLHDGSVWVLFVANETVKPFQGYTTP